LEIAGAGALEEAARRRVGELGLSNVLFLGRLDGEALRDKIAGATASIQAPQWYENGPLSALESLSCGTPVIAGDIGGLPEMIEPGVNGELFSWDSAEALGRAMGRLLADPGHAAALASGARQSAQRRFNASDHLACLEDYYEAARGILQAAS
jgi:glycosyltransferase involved in cell wall biosynthesis